MSDISELLPGAKVVPVGSLVAERGLPPDSVARVVQAVELRGVLLLLYGGRAGSAPDASGSDTLSQGFLDKIKPRPHTAAQLLERPYVVCVSLEGNVVGGAWQRPATGRRLHDGVLKHSLDPHMYRQGLGAAMVKFLAHYTGP